MNEELADRIAETLAEDIEDRLEKVYDEMEAEGKNMEEIDEYLKRFKETFND